jgi:hypothetical protein
VAEMIRGVLLEYRCICYRIWVVVRLNSELMINRRRLIAM